MLQDGPSWIGSAINHHKLNDRPVVGGINQRILEQCEVGADKAVVLPPDSGQTARWQRRNDRSDTLFVGIADRAVFAENLQVVTVDREGRRAVLDRS